MNAELKRLLAAQAADMSADDSEESDSGEVFEADLPDLLVSQSGLWDTLD